MASGPRAWTDRDTVHVRSTGSSDALAALGAEDRFALSVDDTRAETLAALESGVDGDCVVAVEPVSRDRSTDSTGGLARFVSHVRDLADIPVVALVDDGSVRDALAAGVTDVAWDGTDVLARVDWLCANADAEGSYPVPADTTGESFDAFGEGFFVLDGRWRFVSVNDRAAELLGRPSSDLVGTNLWVTFPDLACTPFHANYGEAVRTGEPVTFEARLPSRNQWIEVRALATADGIATRVHDVTEQVEERRTLERYERILETIDDGIYTLDENFTITHVNSAATELLGYDREELLGAHSTLLADEEVLVRANEVIQDILSGERDSGLLEVDLERSDGTTVPIETHFSAIGFGDGSYGSVGVVRDITERRRYEETLTELNRSTNELFRTETKPEVAQLVVDTAARVLDLETVAVYLFVEDESTLVPAAWRADTVPTRIAPGDAPLWRGYIEGEPVDVDPAETTDSLESNGTSIPLGEHGILVVASPEHQEDGRPSPDRLRTLAELLATNAEAAMDRVDRRIELTRRERQLALRNDELRYLNSFNELLRDINRSLVEAESREGIEQAVCERLATAPSIEFVWIGEYDRVSDAVEPMAWAGAERGYLDEIPTGSGSDAEPSLRAGRTGEPVVVDNVAEGIQSRPWRQRALTCEFRSVASVPLVYNEFVYGVLTVYADQPSTLDDATSTMLAELGQTTANAINGVEAKETLLTESVIEVDLRVPTRSALVVRMAQAVEAELTLEGLVSVPDGRSRLYVTLHGSRASIDELGDITAIEHVRRVSSAGEDVLVEVEADGPTVAARVADLGAAIRTLVADRESVRAVVELPRGTDVRQFVEAVADSHPGTELVRRQMRERPVETLRAFQTAVEGELTDRQFEVLRTAFLSGYFEWPRDRTGQEVADSLGIAQSTFNRHLRVAERKLLSRLFESV